MEDNRILKLYAERSERAIAETERKYGRYCYSIAVHILQSDEDAAECVNDTYLRAWNAIPPQHPRCLRTFLGKITRNLSLNRYEKQTAEKQTAEKQSADNQPAERNRRFPCCAEWELMETSRRKTEEI